MNIYERINAARRAVPYIQKDKQVGEGGYMAVTHDAVTAMLRAHLIEFGILIVPSVLASEVVPTGTTTAKGIPFIRYQARFRVRFVNVETPADCFDVELDAHAIDQGDKSPGKAVSYAVKYAMLKLFAIETGEEEESRLEQKGALTPYGIEVFEAQIAGAADKTALEKVWKEVAEACTQARDKETYGHLKAKVIAKAKEWKKPEQP